MLQAVSKSRSTRPGNTKLRISHKTRLKSRLKKYPKSFRWCIYSDLQGLDVLFACLESDLAYTSHSLALYKKRMLLERIGAFVFESVSNVIEHRVLRLTKHQVYENTLSFFQQLHSLRILSVELILTPCRVRLVISYLAPPSYFVSLRAKKRCVGIKQKLGGYGMRMMKSYFKSLRQIHQERADSKQSVFVLGLE